jgi:hypothetical protein
VPTKEALYKRWKNSSPDLRPWSCLLLRFGLQVSICTGNGRKVRLVDLLAGDTIRLYIDTHPTYVHETWGDEFEQMLDTNPTFLGTFIAHLPGSARKDLEKYIFARHCITRIDKIEHIFPILAIVCGCPLP